MEQHQVPQHIASYEFRLVGDMTLKQFFQVAVGGLIALAFYASPLPGIIKWPAILFFGILGIALAFLPLEERPLSTWILLFLKSIYSPTLYKRVPGKAIQFFAPETQEVKLGQVAATPHGEEAAQKYLETPAIETVGSGGAIISAFEEKEESFLKKVLSVFHQVPAPPAAVQNVSQRPQIVVEEHLAERQPQEVQIPTPQAPRVNEMFAAAPPIQPQPWSTIQESPSERIVAGGALGAVGPTLRPFPTPSPTAARFSLSAAPPLAPQKLNVVVGQVVDEGGKGVEGAILEIRDQEGRPARALRTNKVGHFLTATPLVPGVYQIIIEKDGYLFSPVGFSAMDNIIPPIEIKGKKIQQAD